MILFDNQKLLIEVNEFFGFVFRYYKKVIIIRLGFLKIYLNLN